MRRTRLAPRRAFVAIPVLMSLVGALAHCSSVDGDADVGSGADWADATPGDDPKGDASKADSGKTDGTGVTDAGKGDDSSAPSSDGSTPPDASVDSGQDASEISDAAVDAPMTTLSLAAQVGKELFFDPALSAAGEMSCATCHDADRAYGPRDGLAVQIGGADLDQAGTRAVPSLRYKKWTPQYADQLDGLSVAGPGGGFDWDGRSATLADQAKLPLVSSFEMANASPAVVAATIQRAAYAPLFEKAFGADVFDVPAATFDAAAAAFQAFQLEDDSFHPFSSKFDLYLDGKPGGTLTAAEARGLDVFGDPKKGNCASCHSSSAGPGGSHPLFTDFSYEATSVPRNLEIPANADPSFVDMGVCGGARTDHLPASSGAADAFCGLFKVPTLRNVATRSVFFHNGVIHSLEQAIRFYNTRDTTPQIWYPTVGGTPKSKNDSDFPTYGLITTQYVGGTVQKFDDLPAAYQGNVDRRIPLDGRAAGSAPPMTEQNIADLICFLKTLTDDYTPPKQTEATGPCVD